jgi:hypothetical protein
MIRTRRNSRPLYWLAYPPYRDNWVLVGWEALNIGAVLGDKTVVAKKPHDYASQVKLHWKRYAKRIQFLNTDDTTMAANVAYDWRDVSLNIRNSLMHADLEAGFDIPTGGKRLVRWVVETLDHLNVSPKKASQLLRGPIDLFRFGYSCLDSCSTTPTSRQQETLLALALIGIAAPGVMRRQRCKFCFRWAETSQVFCSVHSQAKKYASPSGANSRSYFIGRKATESLGWITSPPKLTTYDDIRSAAILFAHTLWKTIPNANGRIFSKIELVLASSPRVCAELKYSSGMTHVKLEGKLRQKLDPLELWIDAWPDKIRLAEKWFRAEDRVKPGRRGMSPKTDDRIAQAEQLAASGKSIDEIGQALGISRSAIAKWCARGRAPVLKKLLLQAAA